MRVILLALGLCAALPAAGQPTVQPVPMGTEYSTPMPIEPEPRAAPAPVAVPQPVQPAAPARASSGRGAPPPMLPPNPRRKALEAAASGGSGGISYSGPAGAMSTAASGAYCTVTCPDAREYQVSCPPAHTAFCQCDSEPFASCRPQ